MSGGHEKSERADRLHDAVRAKYRTVAQTPEGHFPYPVGRASAERLGYEAAWLDAAPPAVLEAYVGVGNPFAAARPARGMHVLDVGCGAGLDVFVASLLVGPEGRVVGLDLTAEMLDRPRLALATWPLASIEFSVGRAEALPFEPGSFDLVISNGALNLVPDKDAAFREISRVLRPGSVFAAADLLVEASIPDHLLADMDAWST